MSGSNPESRPRTKSGTLARLLCAVAALAALAGCPRHADTRTVARETPPEIPSTAPADTLRVSQRNDPGDLDPAIASLPDEFLVIRALGEGLVIPAPDGGTPMPAAARSWDVSADGLTYTFHLRHNATWSNGRPVTAGDFVESYRRLLTPATCAPKAHLFFGIRNAEAYYLGETEDFGTVGIHALDSLTLELRLTRPMPSFLNYVASGPWIPVDPATIASRGRAWTRPGNHVGNGPYVLEEWKPGQRITVRRNKAYWNAAAVSVQVIQFVAMDNAEAEERAFRAGQLDVTMAIPVTKISSYRDQTPPVHRSSPLAETRYLCFNTQSPPLKDLRVRKALSIALHRTQLAEMVLHGGQEPAYRFLPPGIGQRQNGAAFRENIEEARQLLAEAGFPKGRGFPRLEFSGWTNQPVMETIQAMWRDALGINVEIVMRDARMHVATLQKGRYDIGFIVSTPDVADPALVLRDFLPGASYNYPRWVDVSYASALNRLEAATDPKERERLLIEAEQRLLCEYPLTPLYFNTRNYLVHPRVRGWSEDALWNRFYVPVSLARELSAEAE